jgi:predicted TIM-barrel fold metal-dependent hydrolase
MVATYTSEPIRVVDADSHYTEPPGHWVDHAPAKFKERVPRIVEDQQGMPRWVIDGKVFGAIGYTAFNPDGSKIQGESAGMTHRFEDVHPGAYNVKARLGWLDSRGIYQQVLFPQISGFGGTRFITGIEDPELRLACVTIHNDAIADVQRESGGRLIPLALVPFWDIEHAVKEVRRARTDLGLKGISMTESPQDYGMPKLNAPEWEPFWSACEELGLAVAFHIGSGSSFIPQASWIDLKGTGEFLALITVNSFLANSWLVSNLIFGGVLLRHPRLKIFSAETGIGWMPFLLETMDYQWKEEVIPDVRRDAWRNTLPSEIFRRNCFVSYWFEHFRLPESINYIGEDCVMFETDFPHGTALAPDVTDEVARTLASLRPEVRRKVLRDNAARLFDLSA